MASSQAEPKDARPEAESSLRLLRNPLKLRSKKPPIVGAEGHVFDGELACSHCGRAWIDQRVQATRCGTGDDEPEMAGPGQNEAGPVEPGASNGS